MALYGKADARVVALTLERQGTREPGALLAGDALLPGSQNALALFAAMARSIVIAHCVAALGTDGSVPSPILAELDPTSRTAVHLGTPHACVVKFVTHVSVTHTMAATTTVSAANKAKNTPRHPPRSSGCQPIYRFPCPTCSAQMTSSNLFSAASTSLLGTKFKRVSRISCLKSLSRSQL